MTAKEYRPDIDGLRALAVLAVVGFHFGVPGMGGGFAGVDVFFVISGYLIGGHMLAERAQGRFGYVDFLARRARRLLPALLVMTVATLLLAAWIMIPSDYEQLGRAARYQAMFVANVLFERKVGYFDTGPDATPLLHTWSLSVEEQFYLLFPWVLALALRSGRHWRLWIALLAGLSLALSQWWLAAAPRSAFFLLPSQGWELLAGVLLASAPALPHRVLARLAGAVGLVMVGASLALYRPHMPFPGLAALPVVIGSVLLIWAGTHPGSWTLRSLGAAPCAGLGKLSYSWYLWHWPLLVLARYTWPGSFTPGALALVAAASLVAAYASWRWVEQPFRQWRWLAPPRQMLAASLAGLLVVGAVGQAIREGGGWPWRLPAEALRYANEHEWQAGQKDCMANDDTPADAFVCRLGPKDAGVPTTLVWGDSHAAALVPALRASTQRFDVPVSLATRPGCPPVLGLAGTAGCRNFTRHVLETIGRNGVTEVVLAARWSLYLYGDEHGDMNYTLRDAAGVYDRAGAEQRFAEALRREVAGFRAQGRRVWLVAEVPLQADMVPYQLARRVMLGRLVTGMARPLAEHMARQAFLAQLFAELARDPGVRVLDPASLLCADGVQCRAEANGHSLYMDDNHLSDASGEFLAPLFVPLFGAIVGQVQERGKGEP
ncbi:acyltransferase family protein [Pseudomonas typographi]|uniref:acyltransferase family protein n=1 Tax=Pseudomonas typographi TaxID=2715964 RepID=UPI001684916D|nr:acyltransferase family protein [Pseudomonas typographi]MBD1586082.1 acyltransferase [Pseudomonas typographi]